MDAESIVKTWIGQNKCRRAQDGRHWAYYRFADEPDRHYWLDEHIDEINKVYWRHYEFMSIPCAECGAYSPLRSQDQFNGGGASCSKEKIIDYHPAESLPDSIRYYNENGWTYTFFVDTLSDSMTDQATFTLKRLPKQA